MYLSLSPLFLLPWQSRKLNPTSPPLSSEHQKKHPNQPLDSLPYHHLLRLLKGFRSLSLSLLKTMKMRNKGKVHPSPSSSSSSSSPSSSSSIYSPNKDDWSVLKLLPAAILAIVSVLSVEDREVLAYMLTRSMKATNPSVFIDEKNKKNSMKSSSNNTHKPPLFDCECFDCYTSYWFRWDSSPNRELIHQAIEAFEEHLNTGEQSKKGKNKKKEKIGRRGVDKRLDLPEPEAENQSSELQERNSEAHALPKNDSPSSETAHLVFESVENSEPTNTVAEMGEDEAVVESPQTTMAAQVAGLNNHRGLARKVLPDVLGLFNSRLWSLWSTNV